ncbi:hypothetical protein LR48_Vigan10s001200 [Vigna angularis]|uniref:Putative plant transposon protein domain-containing protein n=1 Tax=Phaseolus angularis TaxID=3914 RepID=A0A0L9T2U0_PHAAN|nr:hypothetical protein LR48_Vigan10s001200 [Vigna angularis]
MTSSSGKRVKTMASKRKDKEPEQPHSSRFLSRKHEKHFKVVQDRRLLMERKVGMIPNFAPQFGEQLLGRNWGKLATYPAPANIAVVKEFYTNARKIDDYPAEDYLGYVRGHTIRYDPNSINSFLGTEWVGEQCQFALCMEEGIDFDDVESVLCVPGGHFQRNRTGFVVNIRRAYLNPIAKYWMAFSHANIQPCSHVSDITLSRALLLYCAIRNLNVNIGQVIANEIRMCANTINCKAPLGHPSLITQLCKIAKVDTSAPPFERPRKAIDEAYYKQYCGGMTSSSGKRVKTMASKRKDKEPEQPHSSRFLSRKHEKHFKVVQDRRLLMERKVGMIPNFAPQFGEQLLGRNWGKLATYPAPANIAVVKEFYTNARKIDDYPAEDYLGYVRGHTIRYDPNSINSFLGTEWVGHSSSTV